MKDRPVGLNVIAVSQIIGGIFSILFNLTFGNISFNSSYHNQLVAMVLIKTFLSVVGILSAFGIWKGNKNAYFLTLFFYFAHTIWDFWELLKYLQSGVTLPSVVTSLGFWASVSANILVYLLISARVKKYFKVDIKKSQKKILLILLGAFLLNVVVFVWLQV